VGTRNGLDRFREFAVSSITEKQGLSNSLVGSILQAHDGSMWLGTLNGLDRWNNGEVTVYGKRDGLPDPAVLSLFEDQAGRIWVSTRRGVAYLERGKFVRVPHISSGSVVCMVGDGADGIWISDQLSLYHLHGQNVREEIPWIKLGHKDFAWTILRDSVRGGLWLGFRQGGVAYYKDRSIRLSYGREQGFGGGQVSGLKLDDDGAIWAASGDGLNLIKNGHTFRLSSANGLPCDMVHWVVEDNDDFFWLYTACGLVRVARSELERCVADPKTSLSTTILDNADGVLSSVVPTDSNAIVAKSTDGKIWFLPKDGVSILDPRHLHENKLPPPVQIEQIIADRKNYDPAQRVRLPPLVRDLEIDFTALSFVAPEKIKFRYKLEGYDNNWQEAGNRRQAFYTNLPPRDYRFRVMACNNSSVWNEEGALLDFSIAPAFYQTNWFQTVCVVVFLVLLWAVYQLRVRQLAQQFDRTLEARVSERTRIARELHDTLLQSFQGLLLRFQSVLKILPERPLEARQRLESAVDQAAAAITEGRDAVRGLRSSAVETNDLANGIIAIGKQLTSDASFADPPAIDIGVEGAPRQLNPVVRDEAYRIAAEALRNAFRHAHAQRITVEIRYDKRQFCLRVRDDGKGMGEETIKRGHAGHFGLPGMRERAEIVGGRLEVWSKRDSGTEVELSIPGNIAYGSTARRSWLSKILSGNSRDHGGTKP
jgi:signal transduction histidine kinase